MLLVNSEFMIGNKELKETIAKEIENTIIEIDGLIFVNCTPHELKFNDGSIVHGSTVLAKMLSAKFERRVKKKVNNISFLESVPKVTKTGVKLVNLAREIGIYLIGSVISAQAYGYPVVSPITTEETSRLPPSQRIVYKRMWNCYW